MQRFEKIAIQRFNYGDIAEVDVDLAKLSYAQARFKLAAAGSNLVRSKQHLIAMTGGLNNKLPAMPLSFPDPASNKLEKESIIQQLPKMLQATAKVMSAQANIKVQLAQGTTNPTISLRAGHEESDHILGLTFSMPLQIRNNFKAEVGAANAEMIQAEREAITIHRELISNLEVATVSYGLSREAWMFWEQAGAGTLREQITLLERLWKAGELNTTAYLLQLTQALETKASAIEQREKLWSDWGEWLFATGQIEGWLLGASGEAK